MTPNNTKLVERLTRPATVICAYGAIALGTFGHSAAHLERFQQIHCASLDQRVATGLDCYQSPIAVGLFAGASWPLYWSWEIQQ